MLKEQTIDYAKKIRETEKEIFSTVGTDEIMNMDSRSILLLKALDELLNTSCDIMVAQAEMLDEMDRKLDKLIVK